MDKKRSSYDALGDRMKEFEYMGKGMRRAMKGLPLLARLDGRAFHTFTKGLARPFDERLTKCMEETTKYLVEKTHAIVGYTQSDEISLVWYVEAGSTSEFMFDGQEQKLVSTLAAMATAKFNQLVFKLIPEKAEFLPTFDARVWQMPTLELAAEAFMWRELDATKNAISMAAHAHFSHNSLHGLSGAQKQEKLFTEANINFNDYPDFFKRGSYFKRVKIHKELDEETRMRIPEKHRPAKGELVTRSEVSKIDLAPCRRIENYSAVLFNDAEPILRVKKEEQS